VPLEAVARYGQHRCRVIDRERQRPFVRFSGRGTRRLSHHSFLALGSKPANISSPLVARRRNSSGRCPLAPTLRSAPGARSTLLHPSAPWAGVIPFAGVAVGRAPGPEAAGRRAVDRAIPPTDHRRAADRTRRPGRAEATPGPRAVTARGATAIGAIDRLWAPAFQRGSADHAGPHRRHLPAAGGISASVCSGRSLLERTKTIAVLSGATPEFVRLFGCNATELTEPRRHETTQLNRPHAQAQHRNGSGQQRRHPHPIAPTSPNNPAINQNRTNLKTNPNPSLADRPPVRR
jgi:hypothetical protein